MLVTSALRSTITFAPLLHFWRIIDFIAIAFVGVECELIPAEPVSVKPWELLVKETPGRKKEVVTYFEKNSLTVRQSPQIAANNENNIDIINKR
jgi:hypothetical protein